MPPRFPYRTHPEDGEQTSNNKMALTGGGQFLLLLWKNAKLQSRKKILTVLQIIMPTLGALIFLGIRFAVSVTRYESGRTWPSFDVEGMQQNYSNTVKLAFAPNVTVVQNIITRMETELGIQGVRKFGFVLEAPWGLIQYKDVVLPVYW